MISISSINRSNKSLQFHSINRSPHYGILFYLINILVLISFTMLYIKINTSIRTCPIRDNLLYICSRASVKFSVPVNLSIFKIFLIHLFSRIYVFISSANWWISPVVSIITVHTTTNLSILFWFGAWCMPKCTQCTHKITIKMYMWELFPSILLRKNSFGCDRFIHKIHVEP